MAYLEGIPESMLITARHLANLAPTLWYWEKGSGNPARPSVMVSPGNPGSGFAPKSTLMPGIIPAFARYAGNGTPSLVFWWMVSSYRITPLIYDDAPGAVNSISRYARRFSSVDS